MATFKQGLLRARSHIAMIIGLCTAFSLVVTLELWDVEPGVHNPLQIHYHTDIPAPPPGPLTTEQIHQAQIAWRYFENNYQKQTGLVNSVDNYPATTLWDTASYLLALISAYHLETISQYTFDSRLSQALSGLAKLPLFDGQLPNKSYDTRSLAATNYDNTPNPRGIGWSAIDLARMLVPLQIIAWKYPRHTEAVQKIRHRWQWQHLSQGGQMHGASVNNPQNKTMPVQEGRLGYEQYAAKALMLLGMDMGIAANYTAYLQLRKEYGIDVPTDIRDPKKLKAYNYVVSEPYILDGLEFGFDAISKEFAWRLYRVQEERHKNTGILTAVSEDHIDRPPYFIYNTVFVDGRFWAAITDKGEDMENLKTLSVKAAFGWHALYRTPYTQLLMDKIKNLNDPQRGWFSGLYEKTGEPNRAVTANTNAIILQSLCYMRFGALLK